jgi:hypothetical protein
MKYALFALGILIVTRAQAQNYPWCEYMAGWSGGGRNCGFVSFAQCMETARGNGSDCRINTLYTPPPGEHSNVATAPSHHRHAARKSQKNS